MKGSAVVDGMPVDLLDRYAELCGSTLAHGHARTGDRVAITAYLGSGDVFDRAIADFAVAYADRTDADHAALTAAIDNGRISARPGV